LADETEAAELAAVTAPIIESAPRFSPDGKAVAYVSNLDGRGLYLKELSPGAKPRTIAAQLPKRFRRPAFSPDGRYVYFTTDDDGDEAYAIDRVDVSSGSVEQVAGGEKRRRSSPFFADARLHPGRFLFSGRRMDQSGLVIFDQDAVPGATPSLLYEDAERYLAAVRADLQQVILGELSRGRALWVLELPSGRETRGRSAPRQLYPLGDPAARGVRVQDVAYAPEGDRLFVATDDGGDATHVLALDVRSGRELARFTETRIPGGDIQGLVTAGDSVAFVVDLGTHHELRLLDSRTLRPRPAVNLGLGSEVPGSGHPNSTSGLAIAPDGKRVAVQWSTPWSPPRVLLVDTRAGTVEPLTDAPRPAAPPMDVQVVRIESFDGLSIPTLVYRPKDEARHPVVMQIHGGFAYASTARYDAWNSLLVARGFAVVEPNVRGSGGFGRAFERADDGVGKLNAVRDLGAVGRWIAKQPWADPARMAVMGRSAGGYYTLMALAHFPELWRAGVAIVPSYDLAQDLAAMDADLRSYLEAQEFAPLADTGVIAALSPSTYVDRIRAPLFVYAGVHDVRSTIEQIDALVRDLRSRGRVVEYMREEHEGHSEDPGLVNLQRARILRFLRDAMR
jgi:dipeptidyl aminopeptidase/acylaminoacyl peptidase